MKNKGFTIIELVISIFILSVAVVGIFSAFSTMVILTADAGDRLTATYLAQEGIEIARNTRDQQWLTRASNDTWLDGFTGCDSGCEMDFRTGLSSGSYLYKDSDGFYEHNNLNNNDFTQTKFQRKIFVIQISENMVKVIVNVSWDQKATILNYLGNSADAVNCRQANCVSVEETLFNWY